MQSSPAPLSEPATPTPTPRLSQPTPTLLPPTPTPTSTPVQTPTPGPTVAPDLALEFTRVRPNQFLGGIAARYGVSVEDIARFSDIADPNFVSIGQALVIPHRTTRYTPEQLLLPDSELVYGPAYLGFDTAAFVSAAGGYLSTFSMPAPGGGRWNGAEVVEHVAARYSVGPRVLLALIEARSGWVTDPDPQGRARDYPVGHTRGASGLLNQLEWAADELNRGFYGWRDRGETAIRFRDGVVARGNPVLNAGTVAVQRVLAADTNWKDRDAEIAAFREAYERLFGDAFAYDVGPVLPAGTTQPEMQLPFPPREWWFLTSGPHGGWGSGSGWAALDFVPATAVPGTCDVADAWAVAVAPGLVARNDRGELLIDLDGDGDIRTGWVLQYLHISDRVPVGTAVEAGDPVGRPSCEGGMAESAHLHIARRYNGLWVAAAGPVPFVLGGWQAWGRFEYEGGLRKEDAVPREACDCRDYKRNGVFWWGPE
ncbi:MAG: LysM domain-containing protein [Caldilineae bacterium]|nr:MAG: LysM domain-containing protein [Caldilineae bacterium]